MRNKSIFVHFDRKGRETLTMSQNWRAMKGNLYLLFLTRV